MISACYPHSHSISFLTQHSVLRVYFLQQNMSESQQEMIEVGDSSRIVVMNGLPEVGTDDITLPERLPENNHPSPERRADIDVIIIFLTYGIYLFHLCLIYTPSDWYGLQFPNLTTGSVSEDPFTLVSLGHVLQLFVNFMNTWNMPMFFYLSGQNAYSALFRRSETQFRDERVHRLLVPTLFLSLVTQFPLTLWFFAPRDETLERSYWEYTQGFYRIVNVHQAWFLLYLFIFAQVSTHWLRVFHPAHNTADTTTLSYCGSTSCCVSRKPFNCLTKLFCCLNFVCKPASTPDQFVAAVKWFLGGPIRLALLPGILIGLLLTLDNVSMQLARTLELPTEAFLIASFPFFPYLVIFMLGYATRAADKQIRQDSKIWSWTCFIVGTVLCIVVGSLELILVRSYTKGLAQGIGLWLFLMGSIALARKKFTQPRGWHTTFRTMAMPFYLIHQQVIVPFAAGALWVPYLRSFPLMLVITTFLTITISYLITKSGFLRYFFGLPPPPGSWLPGRQLRGFVPVLVLSGLVGLHMCLANLL